METSAGERFTEMTWFRAHTLRPEPGHDPAYISSIPLKMTAVDTVRMRRLEKPKTVDIEAELVPHRSPKI